MTDTRANALSQAEIDYVTKATDVAFMALGALEMLLKQLNDGVQPSEKEVLRLVELIPQAAAWNRDLRTALDELSAKRGFKTPPRTN